MSNTRYEWEETSSWSFKTVDYREVEFVIQNKTIRYLEDKLKTIEQYLCECLSVFAQLNIAPPEPPEHLKARLKELFIQAVVGDGSK